MRCSKCGNDNRTAALYCEKCGALLSVSDHDEPYFEMKGFGVTTRFTRSAFYAYYGFLAAMWVFFIVMAFVFAYVMKDHRSLLIGVVALLLSPVLALVVDYRLRSYRRRSGKKV